MPAIHVFPAVAWTTFSVHIFICCSVNVFLDDSASTNYFSQFPENHTKCVRVGRSPVKSQNITEIVLKMSFQL